MERSTAYNNLKQFIEHAMSKGLIQKLDVLDSLRISLETLASTTTDQPQQDQQQ